MITINVELDRAAYDVFVGGSIGIPMTEREAAFINTMIDVLINREAWSEMTDSEWSDIENEIAILMEKLGN